MHIRIVSQSDELFTEVEDVKIIGQGIENVRMILQQAMERPNTTLFVSAQDAYEQNQIDTELDDMFAEFKQLKQSHFFN